MSSVEFDFLILAKFFRISVLLFAVLIATLITLCTRD